MAYPHSRTQTTQLLKLEQEFPWVWLFEVVVTTADVVRLARNPVDLTFGVDGDGVALTYKAFMFQISAYSQDSDGSIQALQISASNISREVQAILEYHDLIGASARLLLVNATELDSAVPYWSAEGDVLVANVTEKAATLRIGQSILQNRNFPAERTTRIRFPGISRRVGLGT